MPDAEVADRPDVEAAELEHQVRPGRPAADSAHGGQPLYQLLVASSRDPAWNNRAVEHLDGEVAERRELAAQRLAARSVSSEAAFSASGVSVSPTAALFRHEGYAYPPA